MERRVFTIRRFRARMLPNLSEVWFSKNYVFSCNKMTVFRHFDILLYHFQWLEIQSKNDKIIHDFRINSLFHWNISFFCSIIIVFYWINYLCLIISKWLRFGNKIRFHRNIIAGKKLSLLCFQKLKISLF